MDDLTQLAGRFKNKFGLLGNKPSSPQPQGSGPQYQQQSYPGQSYQGQNYSNPPTYPAPYQAGYDQQAPLGYPQQGPGYPAPYQGGPPPVPTRPQGPPPIVPPRTSSTTRSPELSRDPSRATQAGALYGPGDYPTPELSPFPLKQSKILDPSSPDDYTSETIQNALKAIGRGGTVYLKPKTTWRINQMIELDAFQEIATLGYPTAEGDMAILEAQADCKPHIIQAFSQSGVRIRNLIIEGNIDKLGWGGGCGVMVQLGGSAHNQVLDHCFVRNPRHWSCVQAFEGGHNVRITNNIIGPAGTGWDIESMRWADGISYAANDGLVAGNLIQDTTDGAIVIFGAPGTLVTSNTIVTRTRLSLGAINMVDYHPVAGSYEYTRVIHNTIITEGSMIKAGIGMGGSVWGTHGLDKRTVLTGGTVLNNLITRDLNYLSGPPSPSSSKPPNLGHGHIGYGFPVGSDVVDWTVRDNESHPSVLYVGDISRTLPKYLNANPGPFIHDKWGDCHGDEADETTIDLQKDYVQGKVWGLIEIGVGESPVVANDGGSFRLRLGESVKVKGVEMVFRADDAELCVRQGGGRVLWEGGLAGRLNHRRHEFPNFHLVFTSSGKLIVVHAHNENDIIWDLTPHIPFLPLPPPSPPRPNTPQLIISSNEPHISIMSSTGDILFASSYSIKGADLSVGKFITRPVPSGGSLIWSLSPKRQIVVAHTHEQVQRLEWPLDHRFQVLCNVPGEADDDVMDEGAKLTLQGDGNLVIYSGEWSPTWASGTCDEDRRPKHIKYGVGSAEEPFIELLTDKGERVWNS